MNPQKRPTLSPPPDTRLATACVLLYGDHPDLAARFFDAWERYGNGLELRVGLNACSPATVDLVELAAARDPGIRVVRSTTNLGKPPMMRRLFRLAPIDTEWVVWFDDDSFPYRADWCASLAVAIEAQPDAVMLGIVAEVDVDERLRRRIELAPWYRGRALLPTDLPGRMGRIEFVLGGFWALRTEWVGRLDWPHGPMTHSEDDYLLGEAIRQHGGQLGHFRSGVKVDTAPRRAPSELGGLPSPWPSGESDSLD